MTAKPKAGIAGYIRVSTAEQNLALQRRALRGWAKTAGVALTMFQDKATGTNGNRPGWQRLTQALKAGQFQTLVCWRLDRITRSLKDAADLFDRLTRQGVRLVSLTENIDLDTATGKMLAGILATFAEYENSIRRQRQSAGIAAALAAGRKWGGSKPGWSKVSPAQATRIHKLFASGLGKSAICRAEALSFPTVQKVLRAL